MAWPLNLAQSGLWDAATREEVRTHRTPQSAIAKRRSEVRFHFVGKNTLDSYAAPY